MTSPASSPSESAMRALAKALAPHIAEELSRLRELESAALSASYNGPTCAKFVSGLGDGVLDRAQTFFTALDREGVVDSVALANAIGATPRELSGYLTTPLKRRAAALKLPLPFNGGLGSEPYGGIASPSPDMDSRRTHWQDRDGIAERMLIAIGTQQLAREEARAANVRGGQ